KGVRVPEVALYPVQPSANPRWDSRRRAGPIKDRHGVTTPECFLDQVGAKKAGAPGDENSGHPDSDYFVPPKDTTVVQLPSVGSIRFSLRLIVPMLNLIETGERSFAADRL